MAVTSNRSIVVSLSGDVSANASPRAAENTTASGVVELKTLSTDTTITPPTGSTACTIQAPAGTTATMTLKGVAGDTGVVLHKTDPSSFGLNNAATTFVITVSSSITSVRFIWT